MIPVQEFSKLLWKKEVLKKAPDFFNMVRN